MTATTATTGEPRPRSLWLNRDWMLLWSSQVISVLGSRVSSIAYPLLILAVTGSPVQAGLVGFAATLPFLLFFLPAGALVDRWDRRRVMLLAETGRGLAVGSVALAVYLGVVSLPHLMLVAFVDGSLFVFFDLCEGAALPRIVPPSQVSTAIAQNQARAQGADLLGQPLGGLLFSIAHAVPFAADAISYLVSIGAIALIRTPLQETNRPPAEGNLLRQIREGVVAVWRQPFLRTAIVVVAGINFMFNAMSLLMIIRAQALGADPPLIGTMFAFFGAGGIVGSIAAPTIQRRLGARAVIVGSTWFWVAQPLLMAFVPNVFALGLVAGLGAVAGAPFNVVIGDLIYRVTPDRLMGRVRSVVKLVAWSTIPAGALAAGLLAASLGAVSSMFALAAILAITALLATFAPSMRHVPAQSR